MSNEKQPEPKNFIKSNILVVEHESTKAEVLTDLLESEEDEEKNKEAFAKALKDGAVNEKR